MYAFSTNYQTGPDRRRTRGRLLHRGYHVTGLPRPLLLCRVIGHRPVVDGTSGYGDRPGSRWVVCDRCGARPDPQGSLDPELVVGSRYTGPWLAAAPPPLTRQQIEASAGQPREEHRQLPGPWPRRPTGVLGAEVVLGRSYDRFGFSWEFKVGNAGSEHTLAAHIRLDPLFALHLHTETFGTWLQRRLNPVGYQSRVTGLSLHDDGRLRWQLWSKRDEYSRTDPWWQHGTITLDPRDRLLGPRRYAYEDVGEPQTATVRMPHGDDHEVTLTLQRRTHGRKRRRKFEAWTVDWTCRGGIPTKSSGRGTIHGSGVDVSADAVKEGTWSAEACARIALAITADRTQRGYQPAATERWPAAWTPAPTA